MNIVAGRPALAQIIPDNSLGLESSVVDPLVVNGLPFQVIEGGATRGGNLFHSFETFSVPSQTGVFFNNSPDIDRVISRVTGSSGSLIDGLVATNERADLFLINPNGILFGPNARLFVGSFVASTAEGLMFEDGYQFGAQNPGLPPLLTVNVPVGLQMGSQPGDLGVLGSFLRVPAGETLALVGGEISVEGGFLDAQSGRIELGGVQESGLLRLDPQSLSVDYGDVSQFGEVIIRGGSLIEVSGSPGGSIQIQGSEVVLTGDGSLIASFTSGESGQGGTISIQASDSITVADTGSGGGIGGIILEMATGQGSNLRLRTPQLTLDAANVFVNTFGAGDSGSIIVEADQMLLINGGRISTTTVGAGDAGDISIEVDQLTIVTPIRESLPSGSQFLNVLFSLTSEVAPGSLGSGGTITIQAQDIFLEGLSSISVTTFGSGPAGNIAIQTGTLHLKDGGQVQANTYEAGNGGNVLIEASKGIRVEGSTLAFSLPGVLLVEPLLFTSAIQGVAFLGASGKGGNVVIVSPQLSIQGDAEVSTRTAGTGQAGNIIVQSETIQLQDGGRIDARTQSEGQGGNIFIQASRGIEIGGSTLRTVTILGNPLSSKVYSSVSAGAISSGDGGNVVIITPSLQMDPLGEISASTDGSGSAGTIAIEVGQLNILQGSKMLSSTAGSGDGGNIIIVADQGIRVSGAAEGFLSSISATTQGSGSAGNILLSGPNVRVDERATIEVSSESSDPGATAGVLIIDGGLITLDNGFLRAITQAGDQGNILIESDALILRNQGSITTDASGTATGGNITLQTGVLAALEESEIVARAIEGQGGNIDITATGIFLSPDSLISAASELGIDGVVDIVTPNLEPGAGLVDLPDQVTDLGDLVATLCQQDQQTSSFVVIGRTGIPSSPSDLAQDPVVWQDLRILTESSPVTVGSNLGEAAWYALRIQCAESQAYTAD